MDSLLGVFFANAYTSEVEDRVLNYKSSTANLHIYKQFVDDIYIEVGNKVELEKLKKDMESSSILNFRGRQQTSLPGHQHWDFKRAV